jgi:putative exosortase-associated protein (TIGR04073 family)
MPIKYSAVISMAAVAALVTGCAGPERKLGRGLVNLTEVTRCGELNRSVEQTTIFTEPEMGMTTGIIHGAVRTAQRTLFGVYEVATFPLPNHPGKDYSPVFYPESPVAAALHPDAPVYPDNYRPFMMAGPTVSTDTELGFSGGDVFPFVPGSRFHIFENY